MKKGLKVKEEDVMNREEAGKHNDRHPTCINQSANRPSSLVKFRCLDAKN